MSEGTHDPIAEGLVALGSNTKYDVNYTEPQASLLERFRNPASLPDRNPNGAEVGVHIETDEFSSLCPLTSQPDWATIKIDYQPLDWCVESKSLKLYLMSYRMHGEFHESCVNRICNDLATLLEPMWIVVTGEFTPRGGIKFWPRAEWVKGMPKPE